MTCVQTLTLRRGANSAQQVPIPHKSAISHKGANSAPGAIPHVGANPAHECQFRTRYRFRTWRRFRNECRFFPQAQRLHSGANSALRCQHRHHVPPAWSALGCKFRTQVLLRPRRRRARLAGRWPVSAGHVQPVTLAGQPWMSSQPGSKPSGAMRHLQVTTLVPCSP